MVTLASDNPYPSLLLVKTADPATPAADTKRLWLDTDGVIKVIDEAAAVTTLGGATDHGALTGLTDDDHSQYLLESVLTTRGDLYRRGAAAIERVALGANGYVLTSDGTDAVWAAAGAATDPIAVMFGAADTAHEFGSSSLAGLTAIGTPDTENADTSIPGAYYVADNTATAAWCGRYIAIPAYSFTAMVKVLAFNGKANHNAVGLFVSEATPGKMASIHATGTARQPKTEIFTNPTTFGSTVNSSGLTSGPCIPFYLALVATSTTSVSYYWSDTGYTWERLTSAHNPSMTIGSVGFAAKSENSGGVAVGIDWFRVWNSAKTFLTGV